MRCARSGVSGCTGMEVMAAAVMAVAMWVVAAEVELAEVTEVLGAVPFFPGRWRRWRQSAVAAEFAHLRRVVLLQLVQALERLWLQQ